LNTDSRLHCAVAKFEILKLSLARNKNCEISEDLKIHLSTLNKMESRAKDASDVLAMGNVDESWILGQSMFGTTTHYKLLNGGSMMIRLEGDLDDLPMFEQLAVIHEVDLFHEWVPFCSTSRTVTKLSPVELIA
jgi:hypothetical protein